MVGREKGRERRINTNEGRKKEKHNMLPSKVTLLGKSVKAGRGAGRIKRHS